MIKNYGGKTPKMISVHIRVGIWTFLEFGNLIKVISVLSKMDREELKENQNLKQDRNILVWYNCDGSMSL